jgi:dihydrolipoamide dehydrogenase
MELMSSDHAEIEVEVAVIGGGSAGLVAHQHALEHGAKRVLLIEGGEYGTTCARVGCMPSKLLIAAAEAAAHARGAAEFGVEIGELRIDGAAVMARVRRERDRFVEGVVTSTEAIKARDRLRGWARLVGPRSLIVETDAGPVRVEARAIVIAAGSTPNIPASLEGLGERLLTSDSVFELPSLPGSLAIVGSGVIGLELGSAMQRLGVATKILDVGTRMPLLVSEVMQAQARELFSERLDLHLGLRELASERVDEGVRLRWTESDGQTHERVFDYVLAATGRRPQLERLALEAAGIELDERGVPKRIDHRTMRIGDSAIFMAGDITGAHAVLHEAVAEGRIAGRNAARYPNVRAQVRQVPLGIMFTEPNVAVVGRVPAQGEDDCEGEGVEWSVGEVDYRKQGRARVMNQAHGCARVYGRREGGAIFAAELIGPGVEHMAHLLAWAIEQGVTAQRALELPIYHPVLEEGLRTAIAKLAHALSLSDEPRPLDCGPGN